MLILRFGSADISYFPALSVYKTCVLLFSKSTQPRKNSFTVTCIHALSFFQVTSQLKPIYSKWNLVRCLDSETLTQFGFSCCLVSASCCCWYFLSNKRTFNLNLWMSFSEYRAWPLCPVLLLLPTFVRRFEWPSPCPFCPSVLPPWPLCLSSLSPASGAPHLPCVVLPGDVSPLLSETHMEKKKKKKKRDIFCVNYCDKKKSNFEVSPSITAR